MAEEDGEEISGSTWERQKLHCGGSLLKPVKILKGGDIKRIWVSIIDVKVGFDFDVS